MAKSKASDEEMGAYGSIACRECGERVPFDVGQIGDQVDCPECGKTNIITLGVEVDEDGRVLVAEGEDEI